MSFYRSIKQCTAEQPSYICTAWYTLSCIHSELVYNMHGMPPGCLWDASEIVVHSGSQPVATWVRKFLYAFFQQLDWYIVHLRCCLSASHIGGRFSRFLNFCVNSNHLRSCYYLYQNYKTFQCFHSCISGIGLYN